MDGVEFRICEQILVVAGGALDTQGIGELLRRSGSASGNADDFNIAETAQRFRVDPPHETNSKDGNFQFFHIL
jgi:hypothetical protein